jgi:Na+/H+-dicarboxylate symporter
MLILLLAVLGLAGIVAGVFAWRFVRQVSEETTHAGSRPASASSSASPRGP